MLSFPDVKCALPSAYFLGSSGVCRPVIPMHATYPENYRLIPSSFRAHSEYIAALPFPRRRNLSQYNVRFNDGYVRKKALAVCGKKTSNGCRVCREFFRRFY